nr:MAG TPA: zinc-ribbon domain protein [Caudoviricetes sp.]
MCKLLCKNCNKEFESKSYHRVFCCDNCKIEYKNKNSKNIIKICPVCNKEFKTNKKRPNICCSKTCSTKKLWQDKDYATKILNSLNNLHCNSEIEEKRIANMKKTMQTEEYKNKLKLRYLYNPNMGMSGKKHNIETKKRLSAVHKGKKVIFSEEHKHKLSMAAKGKKRSQECKNNLSKVLRKRTKEQIKAIQQKIYNTKKERGSFSGKEKIIYNNTIYNCSKEEKIIFECLINRFNIIPQYKSEKYPFSCDFYIQELDLYIEFQGFWTHGKHVFDKLSEKDLKTISEWQQKANEGHKAYHMAIEVWTIYDPLKRKTAKENNLNWLEFFTIDQFMNWYRTLEN